MSGVASAWPRARALLRDAMRLGPPVGKEHDGLDRLAEQLRDWAATVDVEQARSLVSPAEPQYVVEDDAGLVLGLKLLTESSTVHSHGWAVLHQLEGASVFERWSEVGGDGATRLEARSFVAGETLAIGAGEVHRQVVTSGSAGTALEVALLDATDIVRTRREFRHASDADGSTALIDSFVAAYGAADASAVVALYRADALLDANVPEWRFQLQGSAAIRELLEHEEFAAGFRLAGWRAVPTAGGAVIETAVALSGPGGERRAREVHILHGSDGLVAEHVLYCTGIWEPATVERQAREAPMVRT